MPRSRRKQQKKKAKEAALITIGGLQKALGVLQDVSGTIGMPGLQAGVVALSVILEMIQVRFSISVYPFRDAESE